MTLTRMADEDYYNGIEGLNTQQKTAFELVQSYFKPLADFNDGLINTKPQPVHIFISGPGETGKSHLIRMIRDDNKIKSQEFNKSIFSCCCCCANWHCGIQY